jgi:hypothetical protein
MNRCTHMTIDAAPAWGTVSFLGGYNRQGSGEPKGSVG